MPQFNDPSLVDNKCLINGEWVNAQSGQTFSVYGMLDPSSKVSNS